MEFFGIVIVVLFFGTLLNNLRKARDARIDREERMVAALETLVDRSSGDK